MKTLKELLPKIIMFFAIWTIVCGGIYTFAMTGLAQAMFPSQANGSIIEIDGKKYGSVLLAQQYTANKYLWGRTMNIDSKTFTDDSGQVFMYATPSNVSPASEKYQEMVRVQVEKIRAAHPDQGTKPIPVDLVTTSGGGLDPHISPAAADYQVNRIAANTNRSAEEVRTIIQKYTTGRFLGVFGEPTVNVLQVNLALDGILK